MIESLTLQTSGSPNLANLLLLELDKLTIFKDISDFASKISAMFRLVLQVTDKNLAEAAFEILNKNFRKISTVKKYDATKAISFDVDFMVSRNEFLLILPNLIL